MIDLNITLYVNEDTLEDFRKGTIQVLFAYTSSSKGVEDGLEISVPLNHVIKTAYGEYKIYRHTIKEWL